MDKQLLRGLRPYGSHLHDKAGRKMRKLLRDIITGTTRIIVIKYDLWDGGAWSNMDVTECCEIGPITDQKYCSKCGKRIVI